MEQNSIVGEVQQALEDAPEPRSTIMIDSIKKSVLSLVTSGLQTMLPEQNERQQVIAVLKEAQGVIEHVVTTLEQE